MINLATHILLVLCLGALGAGALRTASALGAEGALRVVAAVVLTGSAMALSMLALGPFGLSAEPVALALVTAATAIAALAALPPPERSTARQLADGWRRLSPASRAAVGVLAGSLATVAVWCLVHPAMVGDGLRYHLPVVAAWVTGGDAPAPHPIATDAPLEAYPLTAELLQAWLVGLGQGFAVASLFNPAMLGLVGLAGWCGLRAAGCSAGVALGGIAAMLSSPLLVSQLNTITTDVPALAWLTSCVALCVGARRAPGLLVPAVLAAALAIGTKTTTAPMALIALVAAAVTLREHLRPLAVPLTAAVAVAVATGGFWYVRNLVLHGWPLWPFSRGPWGDPVPAVFELGDQSLVSEPGSAKGRLDDYARSLWGDLALLGGAVVAALTVRRRTVLVTAGLAALALAIWVNAPFTAFPPGELYDGLQGSSTRYLLPGIAAAAASVTLAASTGRRQRLAFGAILALAVALNLAGLARLGVIGDFTPAVALEVDPVLPGVVLLVAGALAGGCVALWLGGARARFPWSVSARALAVLAVLGALGVGGALAGASNGYAQRSARESPSPPWVAWMLAQEGFAEGDEAVLVTQQALGTLAGDELRHLLGVIDGATCAEQSERVDSAWLVIEYGGYPEAVTDASRRGLEACLATRRPLERIGDVAIYAPQD